LRLVFLFFFVKVWDNKNIFFMRSVRQYKENNQNGLTLIETLVASAIFVVFAMAIYQLYATVFSLSGKIRIKTQLTEIAGEQFEFIRNLAYVDVGTVGGIPAGVVEQTQTVTRNGVSFQIDTTIRNIDDPADGTLGGTPNDLSPADKKLVEIQVACTACADGSATAYTSVVAPKNLETENGNGALVIKAIDASGMPVAGASVHITNSAATPAINITDETNTAGVLTIVDAPPSTQQYAITVEKNGYSSEQTYLPGAVGNPTPVNPHLTVAANTITQGTFAIDRTSSFRIVTQTNQCAPLGAIGGILTGTKLIGTPNVLKHVYSFLTNSSGTLDLDDIEWDTYALGLSGSSYDIIGTNPISPLNVAPGTTQDLFITLAPNNPNRLVVAVVDSGGLPLAGADVSITGPENRSDTTGVGSVSQTDWSGGGGQVTIGDWTSFFSSSNLSFSGGAISLAQSGSYLPSGSLTSSTIDLGDSAVLNQLSWMPVSQPSGVGANPVKFQIASSAVNDETVVWNFVGPDGTADTYYTSTPATIGSLHDGNRYVRYKVSLSTEDDAETPTVTDVAITYTAGCLPPGQVDFGGLSSGTYNVEVSKSGFQTASEDITINADTYETITLTP
jgi:prepilin-type N-terminal cleavage/methylation domain-containing protein